MTNEMPEWIKKVMENLKDSEVKPIFSDEVVVAGIVKGMRTQRGIEKEGHINLIFVDRTNLQPIGRYVLSLSTASGLINALKAQVERVNQQLKKKEIPEKVTPSSTEEAKLSYIG